MALQQTNNSFHWADYVVLALSLLLSCSVGIYFAFSGGRQKTTSEYLMGNRSMRLVPVSVSMVASFLSAILILGHPAETYFNGTGFYFHLIGAGMAYLLGALLFVTLFYPLKLTSAFEYLEKRFQSRLVGCVGTCLNLITMTMYAGMAIFAPCTATEQVTGNAVRREYIIAACGIIGTTYTMLGGIKAVVWVDAIQAGIMLVGTLAVAVKATIDSGGWDTMWQLNADHGRLLFPSVSPDPRERHSIWGMSFGLGIYWLCQVGVSQPAVQRFSSLGSIRSARLSMLLGIVGHTLMISICTLVGLAIFGRYASVACDIHGAGWADKNQIVTYYVMERMNAPGFPGLFTAALFAAALSSVSSSLSSASTIAWTDLLKPYVCKKVPEARATLIAKGLVGAIGILSTCVAYLVAQLGGTIIQAVTAFLGAAMGPSLGLFLLGGLFPGANWFGATLGPLAGLAATFWITGGSYSISQENVQLPANVTGCDFGNATTATATGYATTGADYATTLSSSSSSSSLLRTQAQQGFLQEYIYTISYVWAPAIGVSVTLLVGLLCSCLAQKRACWPRWGFVEPIPVQARHLLPGIRRLCDACGCGGGIVSDAHDDDDDEGGEKDSESGGNVKPASARSSSSKMGGGRAGARVHPMESEDDSSSTTPSATPPPGAERGSDIQLEKVA